MTIYGVDFTSAPSPRKPITCAQGRLDERILVIETIDYFANFASFDRFLNRPGPWVGGFDFPFGQPRRLIEALGWPLDWSSYVDRLTQIGLDAFAAELKAYRDSQPPGDKHHLRRVDQLSGAISPMMLYGVPVGKMFFYGAPRLLDAGISILPHYPRPDTRVAIEAYPALPARIWATASYKSDTKAKQTVEREQQRQRIVAGLDSELTQHYQLQLLLTDALRDRMVRDASGDVLDAVLACVQAAWAYGQREKNNYGIPADVDPLEGWIPDPSLLSSA